MAIGAHFGLRFPVFAFPATRFLEKAAIGFPEMVILCFFCGSARGFER